MRRAIACFASVLAAVTVLPACGSSNSSSSSSSSTATSTTPSSQARAQNIIEHLPGSARRRGSPRALGRLHRAIGANAHLTGFEGLPLPQKLTAMAANVASAWSHDGVSSATVNVVDSTPVSCQTAQGPVSTSNPPSYCQADQTIALPVGYFQRTLEPLGDAAMLLAVSDVYGYHVLDFVGDLQPAAGLSASQIAEAASCLSGVYFRSLSGQPGQVLTAADIDSVNKEMVTVTAPGTQAAANAVTAQDLTNAFNKGIFALVQPGGARRCLK